MQNPKTLEDVKKVVLAGMRLLYSKQAKELLNSMLKNESSIAEGLAANISGLFRILWDKSGGKIPPEAIPPAITILVYELASFLKDAGKEIDPGDVEDAAAMGIQMVKELLQQMGVGKAKPQQPAPQAQPQAPQPQPQAPQGFVGGAMSQGV